MNIMQTAYVLINCELGKEESILKSLKEMEAVKEVHGTFGAYDIIAKVENSSRDKIRETITIDIRKLQYVRSTLTLTGIEEQG